MKNRKKGFTLAEVLITLGIIGIVAAIMLPNFIQETKRQQLGVKLAKISSNIEKVTRTAALDGPLTLSDVCRALDRELLFNNTNLGDCVESDNFASSDIGVLRDKTTIMVYNGGTVLAGTSKNMGNAVAQVEFWPNIQGLSGGPTSFKFAVTSNGFVVPDNSDACLIAIHNNEYKANKVYGIDANCKS